MPPLRSRCFVDLTLLLTALAAAAGCGHQATPAEGGDGAATSAASPAAPSPAEAAGSPDAFPSIALDVPPPAGTPGVDAAETAAAKAPKSASAVMDMGFAYYKNAAYPAAADAFEKASLLAPKNPEPALYEGLARMGAGDLNAAVAALDRAATMAGVPPKTASLAYLQIGRCRFQQKRDVDARAAFEKSLTLDPRQGGAKLALGTYAAIDGKTADAKRLFTEAVADLPAGRSRAQAYASLGLLAEKAGDRAAAVAEYRLAAKENPENRPAAAALKRLAAGPAATPSGKSAPSHPSAAR